jgi:hypothetical protein
MKSGLSCAKLAPEVGALGAERGIEPNWLKSEIGRGRADREPRAPRLIATCPGARGER